MSAVGTSGFLKPLTAAAVVLLLAGCSTLSADGGFTTVGQLTEERTGQKTRWQRNEADAGAIRERVGELLGQPLTADSAVELALLNNPGLQAEFQDVGHRRDRAGAGRAPAQSLICLWPHERQRRGRD